MIDDIVINKHAQMVIHYDVIHRIGHEKFYEFAKKKTDKTFGRIMKILLQVLNKPIFH